MEMKANQTRNVNQVGPKPMALQNEALAFFNEFKGDRRFMSFRTFMFVTMTNFAANTLHSNRSSLLGTQPLLERR
jgi:hypothetical protein